MRWAGVAFLLGIVLLTMGLTWDLPFPQYLLVLVPVGFLCGIGIAELTDRPRPKQ